MGTTTVMVMMAAIVPRVRVWTNMSSTVMILGKWTVRLTIAGGLLARLRALSLRGCGTAVAGLAYARIGQVVQSGRDAHVPCLDRGRGYTAVPLSAAAAAALCPNKALAARGLAAVLGCLLASAEVSVDFRQLELLRSVFPSDLEPWDAIANEGPSGSRMDSIARRAMRKWQGDKKSGLRWASLAFIDAGQETGFVKARNPRLIQNMRICCLVSGVGLTAELIMFRVWDLSPDRYQSEEQMKINQLSNLSFTMLWVYNMVVWTSTLSCFTRRIPPPVLEIIYTLSISVGMVAFVLATPHYAGRLLGLDTKTHLEPRQLTDTFVVLGLDALVTSTHIVLPIRYHLMLCVQVCSILCYAIPAMVLGSAHPGNFPHTMVAFSMLIYGLPSATQPGQGGEDTLPGADPGEVLEIRVGVPAGHVQGQAQGTEDEAESARRRGVG
ncbi:unnamed protein product [Prorocentrum cordatum]|uniref:Uncharacterized protein n=1 Tax=Prorocentrum cordatum TaxID=2364126 RepID=A0ABN9TH02_9DINO|nr:unnamed protein product [Polarella glacialis]